MPRSGPHMAGLPKQFDLIGIHRSKPMGKNERYSILCSRRYNHNRHLNIAADTPGVGTDDMANIVVVVTTGDNNAGVDVVAVVAAEDDAVDAVIDVNAVVVAAAMPSGAGALL